jgi:DNA-binding HxlR family transcriptional regulator
VRSYRQYCALARGLDVIGDRWALLVVRELLEGPRRYHELLDGLPGIATNLLAERLRSLDAAGVVTREPDGRYTLTPWGLSLREVVYTVARWATPLMARPPDGDAFRSRWLRHLVGALFDGVDPERGELTVEIRCSDEPSTLIAAAGRVHFISGSVSEPDVVLTGPLNGVVGLVAGRIDPTFALGLGVSVIGDVRRLDQLRPRRPVVPGPLPTPSQ